MADNQEIKTGPSLAGRVVEGVKEGIVGAALGAAAGAVTGVALDGLMPDLGNNAKNLTAATEDLTKLTADQITHEANKLGGQAVGEVVKSGANAIGENMAANGGAISTMGLLTTAYNEASTVLSDALPKYLDALNDIANAKDTAAAVIDVGDTVTRQSAIKEAVTLLTDPATLATAGAVAGGTFKAGEGLLSSQSDKRQDVENAVQQQQIQALGEGVNKVGQLAGMALASAASANENAKIVGQHTARLAEEHNRHNLLQTASQVERVTQQRAVDPTTQPSRA